MAVNLLEQRSAFESSATLRIKASAAIVIAAQAALVEAPGTANHVNRVALARRVLVSDEYITPVLRYAIATNVNAADLPALLGLSDAAMQTAANATFDVLVETEK